MPIGPVAASHIAEPAASRRTWREVSLRIYGHVPKAGQVDGQAAIGERLSGDVMAAASAPMGARPKLPWLCSRPFTTSAVDVQVKISPWPLVDHRVPHTVLARS